MIAAAAPPGGGELNGGGESDAAPSGAAPSYTPGRVGWLALAMVLITDMVGIGTLGESAAAAAAKGTGLRAAGRCALAGRSARRCAAAQRSACVLQAPSGFTERLTLPFPVNQRPARRFRSPRLAAGARHLCPLHRRRRVQRLAVPAALAARAARRRV